MDEKEKLSINEEEGCHSQASASAFLESIKNRRLIVDDEQFPETSETLIYMAMIHLMLKRLARKPKPLLTA